MNMLYKNNINYINTKYNYKEIQKENKNDKNKEDIQATAKNYMKFIHASYEEGNYDQAIDYILQLSHLAEYDKILCTDDLILNNVPEILFIFIQNSRSRIWIPAISCLINLTCTNEISKYFATPKLLDYLIAALKKEINQTNLSHLIHLLYNLLCSCYETISQYFISNFSFNEFHKLMNGKSNGDIIVNIIGCCKLLTTVQLTNEQCTELLLFIREFSNNFDQKEIINNFCFIIYHLIETKSLRYQEFYELGFCSIINEKLKDPNQVYVVEFCRVISSLYTNFKCNYIFDIPTLTLYIFKPYQIDNNCELKAVSASFALANCFYVNENIILEIVNQEFIRKIIICAQYRTFKCKYAFMKMIENFISKFPTEFISLFTLNIDDKSIFSLIFEMIDSQFDELILISLNIIYQIIIHLEDIRIESNEMKSHCFEIIQHLPTIKTDNEEVILKINQIATLMNDTKACLKEE